MNESRLSLALILVAVTLIPALRTAADAPPESRLEALEAFARLYGYVRFFHPSDEAAALDWDAFAVYGADTMLTLDADVVGAPDALATALEELFAPVAPTLRVFREGAEPPPIDGWPESIEGLEKVVWQHQGLFLNGPRGLYQSARTHRVDERAAGGFGNVARTVSAVPHRGREVRLRAAVRVRVESAGNHAQLWLRVDRAKRQGGFFDNMGDRPITGDAWEVYEIRGPIADDAETIAFGGFLHGSGEAAFDAFELTVSDGEGGWQAVELANAGFEAAEKPEQWGTPSSDYSYAVVADAYAGERALRIQDKPLIVAGQIFDAMPEDDVRIRRVIGAGLEIDLPLVLWSADGKTVPSGTILKELDVVSRGDADPAVHVAAVTIAWNVFQHAYPYFDVVDVDWRAELPARLAGALEAADDTAQLENLQRLVAALEDGHGNVFSVSSRDGRAGLPWMLEVIKGEITVVASEIAGVERGDVLVSLDGAAAGDLLKHHMALASGSPQWRRYRALARLGFGPKDSIARITVRRAGVEATAEAGRTARRGISEFDYEPIEELDGGFFYVDLSRAEMDAIRARIDDLAASPGVVFDLRGYPNGNHGVLSHLSDEPLRSAHWIVPHILYPDQEEVVWHRLERWNLAPAEPRFKARPVFLTGPRAISYAESVMGIVEAYELGEIVGATTAAANGNINPFEVPGGYRFIWTGMKVIKHDESQHHLVGISPTVPVVRTLAGVRAGRDEVLERGIEVLRTVD